MTFRWLSVIGKCLRVSPVDIACHSRNVLPKARFQRASGYLMGELNNVNLNLKRQFHAGNFCLQAERRNENASQRNKVKLPSLMAYPLRIIWPSLMKTLSNWISSSFIITPYFDQDFSLKSFSIGANQAMLLVSSLMAKGDMEQLECLVHPDALAEIKKNLAQFTYEQRLSLEVNAEDIYLEFPYQVGIMFEDRPDGVQERFVEITACFHVFRGLSELQKREDFHPGPSSMMEHSDRIMICNYRFIREFTKGVQGSWVINFINHFHITDED